MPKQLDREAAKAAKFTGPVIHTGEFASNIHEVLEAIPPGDGPDSPRVVVVGGGKSAQEYVLMYVRFRILAL